MMDWSSIMMSHVCPAVGCIMSTLMFAAPARDLEQCVVNGSLGALNPIPWAIMSGNCFGWVIYAYFKSDPYILASNLPGFLISLWLNIGAIKLQYLKGFQTKSNPHSLTYLPQEQLLGHVIALWSVVVVYTGWISSPHINPAQVVGILVNANLIFFYASPLQAITQVIRTHSSDSIHVGTTLMNIINTSFWVIYGVAQGDWIIIAPNVLGFLLGAAQGALCLLYSRTTSQNDVNGGDVETATETSLLKRYQTQATSHMSSLSE